MGTNFVDLTGLEIGYWKVVKRSTEKAPPRTVFWECKCICGIIKSVNAGLLKSGRSSSCGCMRHKLGSDKITTHGNTRGGKKTSEYRIWAGIKQRCSNPNASSYDRYGGRGIKMSDNWVNSFETFLSDMGPRPSKKHSIDRKDVNGDYSPENCKWSTTIEQSINKSKFKNNNSGYKGLTWIERISSWRVVIGYDNKTHFIGYFKVKNEAIEARKEAESKYWEKSS